jgi:hypothetical protein
MPRKELFITGDGPPDWATTAFFGSAIASPYRFPVKDFR